MAQAIDATSSAGNTSGATLTFSHTCATGAVLFVGIFSYQSTNEVWGVTYNGVSMTRFYYGGGPVEGKFGYFYLTNPDSGAHNIVCTSNYSEGWMAGSISLTGVNTSSPINSDAETGATSGKTVTSTVTADTNGFVLGIGMNWSDLNNTTAASITSGTSVKSYKIKNKNWGIVGYITNAVTGSTDFTSVFTGGTGTHWSSSYAFATKNAVSGPANVKTINGLAKASVKTVNGLAIGSIKSINGLT